MKALKYISLLWLIIYCIEGKTQEMAGSSADSTITFKVSGVCEMCKDRIEGALKLKGVRTANWNVDTKMLTVSFAPSRISVEKIHNKIAIAGHDTDEKKAKDIVYNSLPKCCRYREFASMDHMNRPDQPSNVQLVPDTVIAVPNDSTNDIIQGVVVEENKQGSFRPLAGASVVWLNSNSGTRTDEQGIFRIKRSGDRLIVSFAGYTPDTISVYPTSELKIILSSGRHLQEVKVTSSVAASYIKSYSAFRTEIITQKALFKAACCNLSESFETNPSVDVSYNDAVTGSKQIQLLGLAGIYAQLTVENLPGPRGLATSLGLNSIPGTWIESIQLSKGTGSVANGYESIAGQINVELKKPATAERLYANVYVNDFGKTDLNLNLTQKLGKKWSTALLLHGALFNNKKLDFNDDGFRDLPTGNLFTAINRWNFDNNQGLMSQFGVKILNDNKTGGEVNFDPAKDKFTTNSYGLGISTDRIEAFGKIGYVFPEKKYQSIGLQLSSFKHKQDAYFGLTKYNAEQHNIYANLIYQSIINSTIHKFRAGLSFVYDNYGEVFNQDNYQRKENVAGAFFEYTYTPSEKFDLVAGIREDHNNLYGWFTTPRLNVRYQPFTGTVIRASVGRGQRTANIFAENNGVFVSSRQVTINRLYPKGAYGLKPEIAWNKGLTLDQKFTLFNRAASLNVDYFRNDFTNQVIVDIEESRSIKFYNLQGRSYSNSFQGEVSLIPLPRLDVRLAYRLFDVKATYGKELKQKPFTSQNRGFINLGYEVNGWKFDYTTSYNGRKRLPSTAGNPVEHQRPVQSPSFITINGQVSKTLGKKNPFDIYIGGENLSNYYQKDAIISSSQPFSEYFDASLIWGPLTGRMLYAGLRFRSK